MTSAVITAIFAVSYLCITIWLCRGLKLNVRAICAGGLACALTLVLASIMIPLPTGATITCGSCIPLLVLALVYDPKLAYLSGFLCGILAMILIPVWAPVHWAQIFVEQLVCFSCLGYAGIFGVDKRWKCVMGMVLALFLKFVGHVMSGVVFFSNNAWDGWGAWGYSLTYHLTSKVPESIATILLITLLPIATLRRQIHKQGEKIQ